VTLPGDANRGQALGEPGEPGDAGMAVPCGDSVTLLGGQPAPGRRDCGGPGGPRKGGNVGTLR